MVFSPSPTSSNRRVIVVEDNAQSNHLYLEWLRPKFDVTGFPDGGTALRQLGPSPDPTVFVLDFNLPGQDGISLKRALEQQFPKGRYLLISGLFDERLKQAATEADFQGMLSKPFSMQVLTAKVEELFGITQKTDFPESSDREKVE